MIQWCIHVQPPRQGTSHKKRENFPCQDMAVVKENNDVIVAVLSDGLGQLEYSGMAADAITKSLSIYFLKEYKQFRKGQFKKELLKETILTECRRAIQRCSDSSNISMSKMDCTLLFVVLFKDASQFICGQLGDGAICFVNSHQGFLTRSSDDKFKATSNLTKTVLSKDALDYFDLQIYSAEDFMGFFLSTDGLENEIYSKAGKVKKKVEWYFNLISNNDYPFCINKINNRWDELTSEEKYGFTDDMSLIAIVQQNTKIELPEEATWRCACGNRNRMESTRCESCNKDFLKVYKGINFKQTHGSKLAFFTHINEHPEEEISVLKEYCEYPLEFFKQECEKVQEGKISNDEASLNKQSIQLPAVQSQSHYTNDVLQQQLNPKSQEQKMTDTKTYYKYNRNSKLNILVCLLMGFIFGILVHIFYDMTIIDNSKNANEALSLQRENDRLQSENDFLSKRIEFLDTRIVELEDDRSKKINIPDDYDYYTISNGNVYIGQLSQGFPNGIGAIYSSEWLLVGCFQNGMKNGEFYLLYNDGHSSICRYENDKLVSETSLSADETTKPNMQADEKETLDNTTVGIKAYTLICDTDIRQTANCKSSLVTTLKKGDIVQSNGNTVTDRDGVKWLEVTTVVGYNGWIRVNQVQEIR